MIKNKCFLFFTSLLIFHSSHALANDPWMANKIGYFITGIFFYIPIISFILSLIIFVISKIFKSNKYQFKFKYLFIFGLIFGYSGVFIWYNDPNLLDENFISNPSLIITWVLLTLFGNIIGCLFSKK